MITLIGTHRLWLCDSWTWYSFYRIRNIYDSLKVTANTIRTTFIALMLRCNWNSFSMRKKIPQLNCFLFTCMLAFSNAEWLFFLVVHCSDISKWSLYELFLHSRLFVASIDACDNIQSGENVLTFITNFLLCNYSAYRIEYTLTLSN